MAKERELIKVSMFLSQTWLTMDTILLWISGPEKTISLGSDARVLIRRRGGPNQYISPGLNDHKRYRLSTYSDWQVKEEGEDRELQRCFPFEKKWQRHDVGKGKAMIKAKERVRSMK